jgi:hypothetical protein
MAARAGPTGFSTLSRSNWRRMSATAPSKGVFSSMMFSARSIWS